MNNYKPKYPLIWEKDDFYIKIFCSIPNIATGIILTTNNSTFLVDPGDGILRDLNKDFGKDKIFDVSDIFISHGHHDHVGGIWSLLTYLTVMKRKTPLNIYFPKGCIEIQSIYRAFHSVYSKEVLYEINLIEIESPSKFTRKDIEIYPFRVVHKEQHEDGSMEEVPALGFKFTHDEKSICYGGDTAYCDTLVNMSKGSDLAIIEAGALENDNSGLHMTIEEAIKIGETAQEYFLVHVPD